MGETTNFREKEMSGHLQVDIQISFYLERTLNNTRQPTRNKQRHWRSPVI